MRCKTNQPHHYCIEKATQKRGNSLSYLSHPGNVGEDPDDAGHHHQSGLAPVGLVYQLQENWETVCLHQGLAAGLTGQSHQLCVYR